MEGMKTLSVSAFIAVDLREQVQRLFIPKIFNTPQSNSRTANNKSVVINESHKHHKKQYICERALLSTRNAIILSTNFKALVTSTPFATSRLSGSKNNAKPVLSKISQLMERLEKAKKILET